MGIFCNINLFTVTYDESINFKYILTLHRVDKNSYFLKNDSIADLVEFGSLNGVYK